MAPPNKFESRRPEELRRRIDTPEDTARGRVANVQRSIPANQQDRSVFIDFLQAAAEARGHRIDVRSGAYGRPSGYGAPRYEPRRPYGDREYPASREVPQRRFEGPMERPEDVQRVLDSLQVNGMRVEISDETLVKNPESFLSFLRKHNIKGESVGLYVRGLRMTQQRLDDVIRTRCGDFRGKVTCDGFRITAEALQPSSLLRPGDKLIATSGDVFIERAGRPDTYETLDGKHIVTYKNNAADSEYQYYENAGGQPGRRVQQDVYHRYGLLRNRSWVDGGRHLAAAAYSDRNQERPSNVIVYDQGALERTGRSAHNVPPQGLQNGFNVLGDQGGPVTTFANWTRSRGLNVNQQNATALAQQYAREIASRLKTPREIAQFISGTLGTRNEYVNNWHPGEGGKGARLPAGVHWEFGKFRSPLQALAEGKADCRSASLIGQYLLKLNGIESIVGRSAHGHYKCSLLERSGSGYSLVAMDEFGFQRVTSDAPTPEDALKKLYNEPREEKDQPQEIKDLKRITGIDASISGVHYQMASAMRDFAKERNPQTKQALQSIINTCNAIISRDKDGGISILAPNGGIGMMTYAQAAGLLAPNLRRR